MTYPPVAVEGPEVDRWLTTDDGVRLATRGWRPGPTSSAGIVVVHGFSASSHCPDVVAVAERLRDDGYHVLSYDARGHGASGGCCALGNDEHRDVAAAVRSLRTEVDRIVVVGASAGAIAALRFAAGARDIAGVVTVSCPARWQLPHTTRGVLLAALTRTSIGRRVVAHRLGVRLAADWHRPAEPADLAGRLSAPLAVVHGDADRIIPATAASELHRSARPPCRLLRVEGMGHAFEPASVPVISDAVRWALSRSP